MHVYTYTRNIETQKYGKPEMRKSGNVEIQIIWKSKAEGNSNN